MAVYSFIGFTSAFLAPLVFGVVLDIGGGNQNQVAWGLAFISIGVLGVLAPIARVLARHWVESSPPPDFSPTPGSEVTNARKT
jgi:MFS family permease